MTICIKEPVQSLPSPNIVAESSLVIPATLQQHEHDRQCGRDVLVAGRYLFVPTFP
jgi:hypothetical protein